MSDAPENPAPPASQSDGWVAAASSFISTRIELIRLEARDASQEAAKRGGLLLVILIGTFLVWLLGVAGLIGWISHSLSVSWYSITLIFAAAHLLLVIIAAVLLKKPAAPSFPITRAELLKDQAWLETLNKDPKSPN
ncbi:phage holin family protein [Haloferula chungangensis]|uniref:Phage holin family protein n=1 Tax=Haloferula chungangensis TaxID=1048331 RepID=A0ABW2LCL1_9BACT